MATVRLSSQARRSYERLARSDRRLFARVDRALDRIAADPDLGKPLVGPLRGHRSHRLGSIRVLYRMEADTVLVLDIAERGAVYRREK